MSDLKTLFIFVDSLGIGRDDPATNPLHNARFLPQSGYSPRILSTVEDNAAAYVMGWLTRL